MSARMITVDGNEAVARIAYHLSELIAIYPITPASPMGEWADEWAAAGLPNVWGTVPTVVEMQSEGGAAGTLHGAVQAGALATTFTASQGLLLMLPNLFKLAGELSPTVIHVAARTIATHALSIFGDHSDVMACRSAGAAMLASGSVQEAMDFALIAHAATLEARLPFLHFFDGFRTSHEIAKIVEVSPADMRALVDDELIRGHRQRALSPDHPVIRGTAQNPDAFFQSREAANRFYLACPAIVQAYMDRLAAIVGREYRLFDYVGAPDATRVIVMMGSGSEAAEEVVRALNQGGDAVGVLKVRLFRPFAAEAFVHALPASARAIAVLDRTKESGALGDPLYLDVVAAIDEAMATRLGHLDSRPTIVGGRYGLSSKEFTPPMVKAIFATLADQRPRRHFTVGITDDVTRTSLEYDERFDCEDPEVVQAVFYGLGADGTVGANKNAIKIIGETTPLFAQGYFLYDSKKAGAMTVSHLRFGPRPIHSTYLIRAADFVACHQFALLERADVLDVAAFGAVFLLNSPYGPDDIWDHLPETVRETIVRKALRLYVIDADGLAAKAGLGRRINTIMQTCFFALSRVLPAEQAIDAVKEAIHKSYGKRGEAVVAQNCAVVDLALEHLRECNLLDHDVVLGSPTPSAAVVPDFVRDVTLPLMHGRGDSLPVSAFPVDGTFPPGTSKWEKRNLAATIPEWDEELCIQCGKCVMVCPHSALRAKVYEPELLTGAPATFKSSVPQWKGLQDLRYTLQVAPEDCTGCSLCVAVCPVQNKAVAHHKALNMVPQASIRGRERKHWEFFLELPDHRDPLLAGGLVKRTQLLQPLFEFSGACAGCGETPYLRLLTQLFGDRAIIANATGCSSIYGGNLPTTPYTVNCQGRGPAWANSLFEDNAEFGLGIRLAIDAQRHHAESLLKALEPAIGSALSGALLHADQTTEAGVTAQRSRVEQLITHLDAIATAEARDLRALAGSLVRKSVWIVGGDGWAYDIGFGGLDHVLASGENVKLLVLDTEVYSNTGGQRSKSTPRGAVARFAAAGKPTAKKDLALMAMSYGHVYVARVALGANDTQTVQAFEEAEAFDGPALIIAYSPCVAHGYDLAHALTQQKLAVRTAYWPLLRYNPARTAANETPLVLDSRPPSEPLSGYLENELRFTRLTSPEGGELLHSVEDDVVSRWRLYTELAARQTDASGRSSARS